MLHPKSSYTVSVIGILLAMILSIRYSSAQETIGGRLVRKGVWKNQKIEYVDRQIAIKIKPTVQLQDVDALLRQHQGDLTEGFDRLRWGLIEVPEGVDIFPVVEALELSPMIEAVEPNGVLRLSFDPNDPYYSDGHQWALKNWGQNPPQGSIDADIDAPEAWSITRGSSGVIIAILDTGIPMLDGALSHPDLDDPNKIILGPDLVDQGDEYLEGVRDRRGHGTHVAGILSAETNNSTGVAGVAGDCRILIVQAFNSAGIGSHSIVKNGVLCAVDSGAKVINLSAGYYSPSQELFDAVSYANSHNVLLVASVGNNDADSLKYPARYSSTFPNVIAVGATDHNDTRASYSNKGPELSLVAPGGYGSYPTADDIFSTTPNYFFSIEYESNGRTTEWYGYIAGTSQAAPHVSGVAALILSVNPTLTPSQVRDVIRSNADKVAGMGGQNFTNEYGYGRLNAYQALLHTPGILEFLASSNKSLDQTATAYNNARQLARDASAAYYLVFASGGEIFYRKTTDGSTWQAPVRLSNGLGGSAYPCIAERSGTIIVVWQRQSGSTHNVHYRRFYSGSWGSVSTIATSVGSAAPLPVVASEAANIFMTVYRSGNNLKWRRSTNNGSSWSSAATISAGSGEALNSPSLVASRLPWAPEIVALAYATKEIPNASHIITKYYYGSGPWSSNNNISSGLPGNLSQHSHPSASHSGESSSYYSHVAWDAYDSQYGSRVIIHRLGNSWGFGSQYNEYHYQNEERPNITGLASNTAEMAFRTTTPDRFFLGHFDGSGWSIQFPTLEGYYPTFSVGGTQAKYAYTIGSTAPYEVKLSATTFSKPNLLAATNGEGAEDNSYYHRAVGLVDAASGAWFNVRVENFLVKHRDGSLSFVPFTAVPWDTVKLSSTEAWKMLASSDFLLPADAESLIVALSIAGEKVTNLSSDSPLQLEFKAQTTSGQLTDRNFPALMFASNAAFNQSQLQLSIDLNGFGADASVRFKTDVANQSSASAVIAGLGHIYDLADTAKSSQPKALASHEPHTKRSFVLEQNYPNPFNPETQFQYSLPKNTHMALRIYNMTGQLVTTVFEGDQTAGDHVARWNGLDSKGARVGSGVYFLRMEAKEYMQVRKITMLK